MCVPWHCQPRGSDGGNGDRAERGAEQTARAADITSVAVAMAVVAATMAVDMVRMRAAVAAGATPNHLPWWSRGHGDNGGAGVGKGGNNGDGSCTRSGGLHPEMQWQW